MSGTDTGDKEEGGGGVTELLAQIVHHGEQLRMRNIAMVITLDRTTVQGPHLTLRFCGT